MKNQALFSPKDKSKKLKCHLLQFLFGALRVNGNEIKVSLSTHHTETAVHIFSRRGPSRWP